MTTTTKRTPKARPVGFIKVLEEDCKGCALCVDVCPQNALRLSPRINRRGHHYAEQVNFEVCTGCALCYIQCPGSAIVVYRLSKNAPGKP